MMLTLCIFVVSVLISWNAAKQYPYIDSSDIEALRIEIREAIDNSSTGACGLITCDQQPLIGSIVRLVFHDCTGKNIIQNPSNEQDIAGGTLINKNICNGCFDFDDPQSFGLEENAFDPLEDIYKLSDNLWHLNMSRADFWIAAATIALEYAAENQFRIPSAIGNFIVPSSLPDIPYYFGREDCPRSPYATEKNVFNFPDALAAWQETKEWFIDNLWDDITIQEIVALMGGHSVGRSHADASGYVSRWTTNINVLNSEYYFNFLTKPQVFMGQADWTQRRVGTLDLCLDVFGHICDETNDLQQWVIGTDTICCPNVINITLQLNTDISLALDIEPYLNRTTGVVSCSAPSPNEFLFGIVDPNRCNFQIETHEIVNTYALNNGLWLNDFALVWEKMVLNGLSNGQINQLQKLIVPYNRSIEDTIPQFSALSGNQQQDDGQHSIIKNSEDNDKYYYYASIIAVSVFIIICVIGIVYKYYANSTITKIDDDTGKITECAITTSQD